MRELFIDRSFRPETMALVNKANVIIDEYQGLGFTLTLRQLYYQFVARALIPNKQSEYKRLGSIVNDARLAGMMDWDAIEDRTRNVKRPAAWSSPAELLAICADMYQESPWVAQDWAPEVWIEKDALIGVVEPVCERMRVPFFACRGYTSQSEAYGAGKRFAQARARGYKPIVFHLGDHDPSGIDMTRDNGERVAMFARSGVKFVRLALNMNQVEQYNPPPNPAKETDSRFVGYREVHGDESWELDALEPTVIDRLIQDALDGIIERSAWDAALAKEADSKGDLRSLTENWPDVAQWLQENANG